MNIWQSIDGYKQAVGLTLIGIAAVLDALGFREVATPLAVLGGIATTGGAGHKIVKKYQGQPSE